MRYIFSRTKGGREIGLRFDHTVPLARVVAQNPQLPLPFRRYAIGKVWRYERPQAGRFREFTQADIDIVGIRDVLADVEVVWAGTTALERMGVPPFEVLYNSRRLVDEWGKRVGLEGERLVEFVRTVDKWFKIGEKGVAEELEKKGLAGFLDPFKELFVDVSELDFKAADELVAFQELAEEVGIPVKFDPRMVRGLDYYTGLVFETYVKGKNWGSIGGGGRYDELIKLLSGRDIPATGYSIGVDRLFDLLRREGLIRGAKTVTRVLVAWVDVRKYALEVLKRLREGGIPSEMDLSGRKLRKQLEYASALGIPYVIIVGPREEERGIARLRDMERGEEREVGIEDVVEELRALL